MTDFSARHDHDDGNDRGTTTATTAPFTTARLHRHFITAKGRLQAKHYHRHAAATPSQHFIVKVFIIIIANAPLPLVHEMDI